MRASPILTALASVLLAAAPPASAGDAAEAVAPASVRAVRLAGPLGRRHRANVDYLLHLCHTEGEAMVNAFRERGVRKQDRGWDGEYAGKWLDAAALTAANLRDAELTDRAHFMANALIEAQADDGYMGIEGPAKRGKAAWDVWNHWYAITGWLTHYETFGDAASLAAAKRAGRWLIKHYGPIDADHRRFFRGAWGGGCNVDVAGQLVRLYRHTGDDAFRAFAASAIAQYPPIQTMRETRRPPLTHAYVLSAYLGGVVELALSGGGHGDELPWVEAVWQRMRDEHLYPTGSLGLGERLREPPPAEEPDAKMQETCATVEWLLLSYRLYRATGHARYMHEIERTVYNALLAAQSADGMSWMYYTPLRYEKRWFSGPTRCCYWSGPRGIARLPMLVYATDADGVRVDLLETSTATLAVDGREVEIRQASDYPAAGRTTITLTPPEPMRLALKVRIPRHATQPTLTVNGKPADGPVKPGAYVNPVREWQAGDRVTIAFDMPARVVPMGENVCLARGPQFLAADARDNPDLDLAAVAVPESITLRTAEPAGDRPRYAVTLLARGEPRRVLLTPYADAGNDGARFTAVFGRGP